MIKIQTEKVLNFIIPIFTGLIFIIILKPFDNLLYGIDYVKFFLNPFTYGNNPFSTFISHGGQITFSYQAPDFFLYLFSILLQNLGLNPEITERIFIILTIIISNFGLMFLLDELNLENKSKYYIEKILIIFFYWFNPFSLSVTLWHVEPWFIFQAILPYIFLVVLVLYNNKFYDYKYFLSLLIILFYSSGTFGAYAATIFFIYFFGIFLFLIQFIYYKNLKNLILKSIFLFIAFLIETYFSIAELILWKLNGLYSLNYLTGGLNSLNDLFVLFKYESLTTQLDKVITLRGFLWLYPSRGIISYPWYSLFYIVEFGSIFIPILFLITSILVIKRRTFYLHFLLLLSIIFIIFSVGFNPPFGQLNWFLLKIGGPFLIIANAYYFTMQVYLLTIALFTYILLITLHKKIFLKNNIINKNNIFIKIDKTKRFYSLITVFLVIIIITSSYPLIVYGNHMTTGPMEDSFKLPSSFTELKNFFMKNYTIPDYYVLILPMSRISALDIKIGNGSFPDSKNIFQTLIPYPVIDWAITNRTIILDNLLTNPFNISIESLMRAMHIKYVVINPYTNMSTWYMNSAPNGKPINISYIMDKFLLEGIKKDKIGDFVVFTIPNVTPIADIYTQPLLFKTDSLNSYYYTLSKINDMNSNISCILLNSIPIFNTSNFNLNNQYINLININKSQNNIIKNNNSLLPYVLTSEGNIYKLNGSINGTFEVSPDKIFSINSSTIIYSSTNFFSNSTSIFTKDSQYSYLWLNSLQFPNDTLIKGEMIFNSLSGKYRWVNFYLNDSNITHNFKAAFSFLTFNGSNYIQFSSFYNSQRVSWGWTDLPNNITQSNIPFIISVEKHYLKFTVYINKVSYSLEAPIYPILTPIPNGGINNTLAEKINALNFSFTNFTFGITTINNNVSLNISIYKSINFSKIFLIPKEFLKVNIIKPSKYTLSEGYVFYIKNITGKIYLILFTENSPIVNIKINKNINFKYYKFNSEYYNLFYLNISSNINIIGINTELYYDISIIIYLAIFIYVILLVFTIISYLKYKNNKY